MIKIIKNPEIELSIPKFSCDNNSVGQHLLNRPLTSLLNVYGFLIVIGRPGSGKTSMMTSMFQSKYLLKKVYHTIYLFQPSHSTASLKDNIFEDLPNKYDELTYETLNDCLEKIKGDDPKFNNAIIIDDFTASLKDGDVKKLIKQLIYNRRHLRTSLFFLCQTYLSVEKDLRKLFSNIFIFKVSIQELNLIFEEHIELNKDDITTIRKFVFDKPYNFLFMNTDSARLFKGWDEILY
jgi:energy-coupling factor transporter ATP-binding protein EcfA2